MSDSAARAERFEPAGQSPFYRWEVAGKPVIVQIPHAIVDRLEKEAVESFRSLSSRGSEIGGLLLGRIASGQPAVVSVEDYEAIPCDYSRGPLYRLSEADSARMAQAIARKDAAGILAVGFFRSHTRKGLALDADDLELFRTRFTDAGQIALLIRPYAAKASTAGIFIWESGAVQGEASYLEFPFRSSELGTTARPPASNAPGPAPAGPKTAALSPSLPKAPLRAQIVPIASRRETPAVAPAPPPIEPPAAIPEPVPVPVLVEKAPAVVNAAPAPPVVAAEPAPVLAPPEPDDVMPPAGRAGKLLWLVLGGTVSVLLIAGLLLFSGVLRRGSRGGVDPSQDYSALALRVERTASELLLTWNRDSEPIRNATRAVLSIHDGTQNENVDLDLGQLRNGSIVYSPLTSDVVFQMKLTGKDQAAATTASVRFLSTRPSPMAVDPEAKPAAAAPKPNAALDVAPPPAPAEPAAEEEEKPRVLAQATRKFSAESLAQRLRPATPTDTPEEPALPRATMTSAPEATSLNLGTHNLPAPAAPAPGPAVEKAAPQGGQVKPAQILRRKDPEYPRLAKESGAKGAVELQATIGSDGRVKSVKVIKGHPLLQRVAVDAVMQWVYSPAILNGAPIESQAQIVLNFVNEK